MLPFHGIKNIDRPQLITNDCKGLTLSRYYNDFSSAFNFITIKITAATPIPAAIKRENAALISVGNPKPRPEKDCII